MEVIDMVCLTEQQKQEIVHTGMLVIEFKRVLIRCCVAIKEVVSQLADRISKGVRMIRKECRDMPPRERCKVVRSLVKCGFTEKEINLMIGGAYHCRKKC